MRSLLFLLCILPWAARADGLQVVIEGVTGALRDNVRAALSLAQLAREERQASGIRIRRLYRRAPDEIRRALEPFGYYRPRIEARLVRNGGVWTARFRITPGEPVRVRRLELRVEGAGARDPGIRKALSSFPLRRGDPVRHDRYENGKRLLLETALERGYREARLTTHRLEIDPESGGADIRLVLDTGPRYRFGRVEFAPTVLDVSLLSRYVPFRRGDPYAPAKLLELQAALEQSGYFSVVDVVPAPVPEEGREIPVRVRLVAARPSRYLLGLGYGTDTGFRLRLGWERRYLNRFGHRAELNLAASRIRQELHAEYRIPLRFPRSDALAFSAGLGDRSIAGHEALVRTLGARLYRSRGRWEQEYGLRLENTTYRVAEDSGTTRLLVPEYVLRRHFRGGRNAVRRGSRVGLSLALAHEALASDLSFLRLEIEGKHIFPVGERARLLVRGRVGTLATSDFSRMPPAYRFFAGGDQSVRGYAFESLGPRDAEGRVTGGRQLVEASVELQRPVWRALGIALFLDMGNAVDRLGDPLRRGAGVGLRWRLPVGTAGIDLAFALSEPGTPWRIHVTLGPDL